MTGNFMATAINAAIQAAQAGVSIVNQAIGSGAIQKLFSAIAQGLPSVATIGIDVIKKGGELFTQTLSNRNLFSLGSNIIQTAVDTLKRLPSLNILKDLNMGNFLNFGQIGETLKSVFQGFNFTNLNGIISNLGNKISEAMNNISIGDEISVVDLFQVGNFKDFLTQSFSSIQERFQGFLQNFGLLNQDGTMGGLQQVYEQLKSTVQGLFGQMPGFGDILGKTQEQAQAADSASEDSLVSDSKYMALKKGEYKILDGQGKEAGDILGYYINEDGSVEYRVQCSDGQTRYFSADSMGKAVLTNKALPDINANQSLIEATGYNKIGDGYKILDGRGNEAGDILGYYTYSDGNVDYEVKGSDGNNRLISADSIGDSIATNKELPPIGTQTPKTATPKTKTAEATSKDASKSDTTQTGKTKDMYSQNSTPQSNTSPKTEKKVTSPVNKSEDTSTSFKDTVSKFANKVKQNISTVYGSIKSNEKDSKNDNGSEKVKIDPEVANDRSQYMLGDSFSKKAIIGADGRKLVVLEQKGDFTKVFDTTTGAIYQIKGVG